MPAGTSRTREVVLLIGTVKGVFIYRTDERRTEWALTGPHLAGWEIFSLCGDSRNKRILAGTGHFVHGHVVGLLNYDGALGRLSVKEDSRPRKIGPLFQDGSDVGNRTAHHESARRDQSQCHADRVLDFQVHSEAVSEARAGQRTAVNLQGLETASVARGAVLGHPGELSATSLLDVKLSLLAGSPAPLKDLSRVRFHQGTSELLARVKLLGRPSVDNLEFAVPA